MHSFSLKSLTDVKQPQRGFSAGFSVPKGQADVGNGGCGFSSPRFYFSS